MKLIAWDFDGVLNRGYPGNFDDWQKSFEADLGASATAFSDFIYRDNDFDAVIDGRFDMLVLLEDWVATYGVAHSGTHVLNYLLEKDIHLDEEVLAWVAASPVPGVLATNNEAHRARFMWQDKGLSKHLKEIFASGSLGVKKPSLWFYAAIEAWSGLEPDQILLVDDSEKNIAAAAAKGWQVFHFTKATRDRLPEVLGIKP